MINFKMVFHNENYGIQLTFIINIKVTDLAGKDFSSSICTIGLNPYNLAPASLSLE
jgi:hypothetical protein